MNDAILTQLKIIVERAVRPIRASTSRKRKMREELLAHVSGTFDAELTQFGDERVAIERTSQRFGNPGELTSQLQESVPASDGIWRLFEGRPDESTLRGALRFAWIETVVILLACGAALFAANWVAAWSREELVAVVFGPEFVPLWLVGPLWFFGTALVAHWMENSLHGPEPITAWPRIGLIKSFTSAWAVPAVRIALIAGCSCFLMLMCIKAANGSTQPADWDQWAQVLAGVLLAGDVAATSVLVAWTLVQSVDARRRYHQEWASLNIDGGT